MGDRSGVVGYLMGGRLVQLEGLVADRGVLRQIQASRDLNEALREMGVEYYVRSAENTPVENGCYVVREPELAGPSSPRMSGRFCAKPLEDFKIGKFQTLVFKVERPITMVGTAGAQ